MWIIRRIDFLVTDARKWAVGKIWIWRVIILGYLVWAFYTHLAQPDTTDIFFGPTFVVHQFGHLITEWCPQNVYMIAGSIAQIAVPILIGLYLLLTRDYFWVSVAGGWLASSLYNLSDYIGDAQTQQLPLTGFDSDTLHDWNYLLTQWNVLGDCTSIARGVSLVASLVMLVTVTWGVWLCWTIATSPAPTVHPASTPKY